MGVSKTFVVAPSEAATFGGLWGMRPIRPVVLMEVSATSELAA